MLEWANPLVQASLLEAAGTVIATTTAAIAAGVLGKRFADRKRLEAKLAQAFADIEFLLVVEQKHAALHVEQTGQKLIQRVRREVTSEGFDWSGLFTPGRVRRNYRHIKRG